MDVVLKLRELRRLRGYTQQEAAEKAALNVKTLSSFETGARITSMKLLQLFSMLAAYDMTPAEFFGDGVERAVLNELERLSLAEGNLIASLRRLPDEARVRLEARLLEQIEAAIVAQPARLRIAV
jgi:transcriptional regulator with XRE-family HTH domain